MLKFTKTDRKLELEGAWLDFADDFCNILKVKIARSDGNPHYDAKLTKLMAPYQKQMEKGKNVAPEVAKKIMTQVAASELLLDWDSEALLDDDGNPTPYSEEAAVELLTQDTDLRDFVLTEAGDRTNFLMKKK